MLFPKWKAGTYAEAAFAEGMNSLSETSKAKEGNISQNPIMCLWEALLDRRWQCRWVSLRQAQRKSSPLTSPRVSKKHWWGAKPDLLYAMKALERVIYIWQNSEANNDGLLPMQKTREQGFNNIFVQQHLWSVSYSVQWQSLNHLVVPHWCHQEASLKAFQKPSFSMQTLSQNWLKKKAVISPCRMQHVAVIEFTNGSCSVSEVNSASSWNRQNHQPMEWMQIVHLMKFATSQWKFALLLQLCCYWVSHWRDCFHGWMSPLFHKLHQALRLRRREKHGERRWSHSPPSWKASLGERKVVQSAEDSSSRSSSFWTASASVSCNTPGQLEKQPLGFLYTIFSTRNKNQSIGFVLVASSRAKRHPQSLVANSFCPAFS